MEASLVTPFGVGDAEAEFVRMLWAGAWRP